LCAEPDFAEIPIYLGQSYIRAGLALSVCEARESDQRDQVANSDLGQNALDVGEVPENGFSPQD
jgi:hypothetical protein